MLPASARLLRLLSILQTPGDWTGPELARRSDVTVRTIRNDIEKLRELGYPVHATPGVHGGYRLGSGGVLPPLLLDDDEAVAVAVGLRTAAEGSVLGIEEASVRAMLKLERVLPSRLRHQVSALHAATVSIPRPGAPVAAEALTGIASAIRRHEGLRFDYASANGTTTRSAEPHDLVHARGRWYVLAWDSERDDWRTFRVDRMSLRTPNGPRFTRREVPGGDVSAYVEQGLDTAGWTYTARVRVHAPAESIRKRVPPAVQVEPIDGRACRVEVGSDSPAMLALWLGMLDADFEVEGSPELDEHLRALGHRYLRAGRGRAGEG